MKSNSTQTKIHLQGYGGNKLLNLAGIYRFDPLNILGTKAKTLLMLICLFILSTSQMFAQIALRGTATTGTATGTSLTVAKPTGVAAGDIMIVNIAQLGNNTTDPVLAGWTVIDGASLAGGTARLGAVLSKVATGAEGASYTFTLGSGTTSATGAIVAFSGVDGTTPFDVASGTISVSAIGTTAVTATSKTTVTANDAIIMFGMAAASSPTWSGWTTTSPGALTELYDAREGANTTVGAAWALKATAGATGAGSATLSTAERNGGILIALRRAAVTPVLSAGTIIPFSAQCINNFYGPNSFTITGTNLTAANVTVAALAGFTYSTTVGGTYTTTLSLTQPGGAYSQAIYVRFTPIAVQDYSGNISVGGGGATSINVAVSGSGVNTAPTVTAGAASGITTTTATVPGTISATGCTAITVYGVEYSTTNSFANGTGTPVAGSNLAAGAFSVPLSGLTQGTIYYFHTYATNGGGTAYSTQGTFTTSAPGPSLSGSSLSAFGAQCTNSVNGPNSFIITGTNLTAANVTVGALAGYTYSTTSGGTYTTTLSLTQPGGSYSQQIYVTFTPIAVQNYSGNIPVGGGGASSVNVAASGSGVNTSPTVTAGAATGITLTAATVPGTITVTGCTAVTGYGVEYSTINGFINGNGIQAAGSNLAAGVFSVALSGLTQGTIYYYHTYATNGGGTSYSTQGTFTTTAASATLIAGTLTAFGAQNINSTYGPNTFTITGTNLTTANVTVGALAGFTYSTTSGGTYTTSLSLAQPGGSYSQTIYVRFTPTAIQDYSGNIPVGGGGASSIDVAASGSGVGSAPILTITGVTNHGTSCVGVAATPIVYTITNTGGSAALDVTVTSNATVQFAVSGAPTTIAGNGGTATYTVTFTPGTAGAKTAVINVYTSTPGSNYPTSNLTGTGIAGVAGLTSSDADNIICADTPITFTATGGTSYEFFVNAVSQGAASATATFTTSALTDQQVVTVRATNASGCSAISTGITTTVNALPAAPEISGITAVNVGSITLLGSPIANGVWTSSDPTKATVDPASGEVAGIAVGTSTITYTISNSNNCTNFATVIVTVSEATGIDDIKDNGGLMFKNHPNPFSGNTTLNYTLPSDGRVTITIRNLAGQVVKTIVNEVETQGDYTSNIDLGELRSGVYFATLSLKKDGKEVIKTIRIVKGN